MICELAPVCTGLHRRSALPCLPARSQHKALQRGSQRKAVASVEDAPAWHQKVQSQVVGLGLALALSAVQVAAAGAAQVPDPYKELQSIVNGRSSASPEGLLKSFQKSKQALSQAIGSPNPAAAAGKAAKSLGSGSSLGQDLTKAFTTSPPQIAKKAAAPALPSAPGLDNAVLVGAGAVALGIGAVTVAGSGGGGGKAQQGAKKGANQLKARVQGPARQASKSQPAKQAKQSLPNVGKAAGAFGTQARKVAAAANPASGTTRVAKPGKPGTKPSGGLFGTQKVQGGGTSKVRASPPAAQKNRGGPSPKEGGSNTLLITGIVGAGLVGAGVLFALIPKPDFYAKNAGGGSTLEAPAPLPGKAAAIKYAREKGFETSGAPAAKEEKPKKQEGGGLGGFQLPFSAPSPPKPQEAGSKAAESASKLTQGPQNLAASANRFADTAAKAGDNIDTAKKATDAPKKAAEQAAATLKQAPRPEEAAQAVKQAAPDVPKPQEAVKAAKQAAPDLPKPQEAAQAAKQAAPDAPKPQEAAKQVAQGLPKPQEAAQAAKQAAPDAPKPETIAKAVEAGPKASQVAPKATEQASKAVDQAPKAVDSAVKAAKPSAPSGPDLKPEQAKKPQTGIPLAPPKSEASKPKTPPGPDLAAAPQTKYGGKPQAATANAKGGGDGPIGGQVAGPVKQTEVSKGKSGSTGSLAVAFSAVVALGAVIVVASPKDNAAPGAGGPSGGGTSAPSKSEGKPAAASSSKSDSKAPAGPAGESTPEDIEKRKGEVQDWVKDWRSRT